MHEQARYSIGELAETVGSTRRAIRFYVQRGLLPAPLGRGRGRHYGTEHLERLQQIHQLQATGHSLDAIKRLVEGKDVEPPLRAAKASARRKRRLNVQLVTRVELAEGVQLQLDTAKHDLDVEQLLAIQQAVSEILGQGSQGKPRNGSTSHSKGAKT
jgi:DNA-binding transcriptional MerR regulator